MDGGGIAAERIGEVLAGVALLARCHDKGVERDGVRAMAVVADGVGTGTAVGWNERGMAGAAGGDERQGAAEGAHTPIDNLVTKLVSSTM